MDRGTPKCPKSKLNLCSISRNLKINGERNIEVIFRLVCKLVGGYSFFLNFAVDGPLKISSVIGEF